MTPHDIRELRTNTLRLEINITRSSKRNRPLTLRRQNLNDSLQEDCTVSMRVIRRTGERDQIVVDDLVVTPFDNRQRPTNPFDEMKD